jgi:hypothetical protein
VHVKCVALKFHPAQAMFALVMRRKSAVQECVASDALRTVRSTPFVASAKRVELPR